MPSRGLIRVLSCAAIVASPWLAFADDAIVTNVANGFVYVSLGTSDGVAAGDAVEVLDAGKVVGVVQLDLCGAYACRGKLPKQLEGKLLKGMIVRARSPIAAPPSSGATSATTQVTPAASAAPSVVPSPSAAPSVVPSPIVPSANAAPSVVPSSSAAPSDEPIDLGGPTSPVATNAVAPASPEIVLSARPARLAFKEGDPIPADYVVVTKPRDGFVTGGWIFFGVGYGIALIGFLADGKRGLPFLLPVAGPWIYMAQAPTESYTVNGYTYVDRRKEVANEWSVVSGLGQAIGATLLFFGYRGQKQVWRRDLVMNVAPIVTASQVGFGVSGTF